MNNKVSIILPTRNEEENIAGILSRFNFASKELGYEAIVVDDSNDRTAEVARASGARVIKGRGLGLGQAIIDGIEASGGDIIVVMDSDGQHSPNDVPRLFKPIQKEGYDVVIGSRYVKGGGRAGWNWWRRIVSRVACLLALPVTSVKDATSGFFACRKSILEGIKLKPTSWKIMLEILTRAEPDRILEIPIQFGTRYSGESKFDTRQIIAYIKHLLQLSLYKYRKLIKFCIVGGSGALITFALTWLLTELAGFWYMASLVLAVIVATVWNFSFNLLWTFARNKNPDDADYDWSNFYKGNPVQKWWKQSIAKTVWSWVPDASLLLDVGCGSSPIITRYPEATGIDVNKGKIEFMRGKFPTRLFLAGELDRIMPGEKFDHILCIEVLEHLERPERMIAEIARRLKPDGEVVFATPDYGRLLWHIAEKFTPAGGQHVSRFTRKSLEEACKWYNLLPLRHRYIAGCDLVEMFSKKEEL